MRRELFGSPVYGPRSGAGVQRPRSWAPSKRGRYIWSAGSWFFSIEWLPWTGFYPVERFRVVQGLPVERNEFPDVGGSTVKKPSTGSVPSKPEDVPPVTSVLFKKYPRLLAFLHDRWYDDGSSRFPGALWIDSDLGAIKAMLKEPSLMLCARIRASTIDDLFAAVETFLGLDSPPWEPDRYALERADEKKTKKK